MRSVQNLELALFASLALLTGRSLAQTAIAYDSFGPALTAEADWAQSVAACGGGCGDFPPSATINGTITPFWLGGSDYNGWAVAPFQNQDHWIVWTFAGSTVQVDKIQIINAYPPDFTEIGGPHFIGHFSLDYTTDPSPGLSSDFTPLEVIGLVGAVGSFASNAVTTDGGLDLRVVFVPVTATAVRLHSYPGAGISYNHNFIISEVSFDTCPGEVTNYGTGLAGAGGFVPSLTCSGCPAPGAGLGLHMGNAVGAASGALLIGSAQVALPFKGGTLLVAPVVAQLGLVLGGASGVPGDGALDLPVVLPADPSLQGQAILLQAGFHDAAAIHGISLTPGLRIDIG